MRKIISFMHVSLDGYVAGPNGEMNWIKMDEELFDHVGKRIGKGDTSMYGRVTYQLMEDYWPTAAEKPDASKHDKQHSQWYMNVHKVVMSRTLKGADLKNTTVISDHLADRLNEIKQQPGSEILLFGSPGATHALMSLGLIDGYWLFMNPTILGQGMPLFVPMKDPVSLKLLNTKQFASGVTELNYAVEK